jgi:hypothetical protein
MRLYFLWQILCPYLVRIDLKMSCILIAIFLSYENPPFDSCIFEKHWATQNKILHSKFPNSKPPWLATRNLEEPKIFTRPGSL